MGQQADNLFVLQIDPETGAVRQFVSDVPDANFPTATLMSRTGRLYIGAAYAGHLLSFDPDSETLVDLGPINPGRATFPCRLDEGPDGRIWIGSYPTADLTSYDPHSGTFTRYGRMDDVDMYNYPLAAGAGAIACLVQMTMPHVVLFDLQTGEKNRVGPVVPKGQGAIDLVRGGDGELYIASTLGNFHVDGDKAVAVESVPPGGRAPRLSDGSSFAFSDADQLLYRALEIRRPDGTTREFTLDYEASGSDIFSLHAGPDGCIYGSSILPLHFFRYDPRVGDLVDLGRCSVSAGEAYSMSNFEGKIYIASYPQARLSVYDPAGAYRFGTDPQANPRELGPIDDISYRPRSCLAGPLGRIWTASLPDYGRWKGPLSFYDPATGQKGAYRGLAGEGSCYTLAHLPEQRLMAVGTTIEGGTGTQPKAEHAVLFLWDYEREKKVWEGALDPGITVYNALLTGRDGRLYGTAMSSKEPAELFVFDPEARVFTHRLSLPTGRPLDLSLQQGPDDRIYGFTDTCLYRLDPSSMKIEILVRDSFRRAGPMLGERIYCAIGHRLRVAEPDR
jgi:streptogramin lyase